MKIFLLVLMSMALVSCGNSPLFNHEIEKSFGLRNIELAQSEELSFKNTDFLFSIDWAFSPRMGENKFILKSWHKNQGTLSGPYQDLPYNLNIFLWMPSMGHGSSPVKINKIGDGEYEVTNVYFIMGGKWELKLQLLNAGKIVDETVLTYSI